jgi:glyoxylase-like metal-dependent hydrolase (beta-lactamase superfamily II)/rhodanese-related sulfurtransferase
MTARSLEFRMYFKQLYLGCLAHASYLIGSKGQAAVVDPQRDVDQYIDEARGQDLEIKYVIEIHLHADFVSGHLELAERTGAEIVFGNRSDATFPYRAVWDGDEIVLGKVRLRFLETPGHTPEGISIVVIDSEAPDLPPKVMTGDTLFIGDVGRPDLVGSKGHTPEQMAGMLYESLHNKLLRLDDDVEVFPAHGAGSLCGRNMSKETSSTIVEQRQFNYALKPMPKEDFVRMMTSELPEVPEYFPRDAEMNRQGATALAELSKPVALAPDQIQIERDLILDIRDASAFGAGHISGALNVGLGGQFASWAGSMLATDGQIVIMAETESEIDGAVTRLARVGIENVKGFLEGGMYSWNEAGKPIAIIAQIPVDELASRTEESDDLEIIDVRRPAEFRDGHVKGAVNVPLSEVRDWAREFEKDSPLAFICCGGYRSSAATSIVAGLGFTRITNVVGGTDAWIGSGYEIEKAAG